MKHTLFCLTFLAAFAASAPNALPALPTAIPIPLLPEYITLNKLCLDAGPNAYVGVLYQGNVQVTYDYGECYPYKLPDDEAAQMAVFCKTVSCVAYADGNCTGTVFPPVAAVEVPAGTTLVNPDNVVGVTGKGAICDAVLPGVGFRS